MHTYVPCGGLQRAPHAVQVPCDLAHTQCAVPVAVHAREETPRGGVPLLQVRREPGYQGGHRGAPSRSIDIDSHHQASRLAPAKGFHSRFCFIRRASLPREPPPETPDAIWHDVWKMPKQCHTAKPLWHAPLHRKAAPNIVPDRGDHQPMRTALRDNRERTTRVRRGVRHDPLARRTRIEVTCQPRGARVKITGIESRARKMMFGG